MPPTTKYNHTNDALDLERLSKIEKIVRLTWERKELRLMDSVELEG